LPELWIPYGGVETLVSLQAENLGAVADLQSAQTSPDIDRTKELVKGAAAVFVVDALPATLELVKGISSELGPNQKIFSPIPKRIEVGVPELKGRVATLPPPISEDEPPEVTYSPELLEKGSKVFVGSARPDPLFGILDTKVQTSLSWVAGSRPMSAKARKGMEPQPFKKTEAYEAIEQVLERIPDATFVTSVPYGGRLKAVLEQAPFDAIKNAFTKASMSAAKGMIVGIGGRGYDDTLSSAIRGVWNVIDVVKKTGSILLIAECSEGVGSTALEMLVTGRLAEHDRPRSKKIEGMEEVFYLTKLKDEYDVLLLSGLPETYARSKLGFTTAKGSGEAVGRMLNKVGRTGKLNVVPRAAEVILEIG
jgi:hypothetical protein